MLSATELSSLVVGVCFIGIGATVIMDLWAVIAKYLLNMPGLNYAMLGRWCGHMLSGRFYHHSIVTSAPVKGEELIGWGMHYATGILLALGCALSFGTQWMMAPALMPALVFGTVTVLLPFLIMQPCFGMGVAAQRTPNPNQARIKSILSHLFFGFGLYLTASIWAHCQAHLF